jgi:hypothetical protein
VEATEGFDHYGVNDILTFLRSRLVEATEGCDLAVQYGVKFTETSPGCGHHIDELLVGIVMQLRCSHYVIWVLYEPIFFKTRL